MKLVLVRPNNPSALAVIPPLGIGYLASAARTVTDKIFFIDALRKRMSPAEVQQNISIIDPDYVGVSCMTSDYLWVVQFASLQNRKYKLILGGPHPSVLPKETLEETKADWVVVREGEEALIRILKGEAPHGIIQGGFVDKVVSSTIDKYRPDWELLQPGKYPHKPQGAVTKNKPVAPIMTSRGCPYQCTFCASPKLSMRKIRYREPIDVVREMLHLITYHGIKEFNITDDNFTANKRHAMKLCEYMIKFGLDVSWSCENGIRADRIDEELLEAMKAAGCYRVAFGIESPNDSILAKAKKKERVHDIEKGIDLAVKAGLDVRGWFIFGLPGETQETINKTISWAYESKLSEAQFMILDVIPGSELWDTLDFKPNWNKQSFRTPEYIPEGLKADDIIKAQKRAMRKFYSKPDRFIKTISKIRINQMPSLFSRLKKYTM